MDADLPTPAHFHTAVGGLIADIEACGQAVGDDREAQLQWEAFHERCHRARALAAKLKDARDEERQLLSGDAYRLWRALQCSQEFFQARVNNQQKN